MIAHFFSILPKVGLDEADVTLAPVGRPARTAAASGARIEVSERWRCPSPRTLGPFVEHSVPILLSTDSHRRETIGRYEYCAATLAELASGSFVIALDVVLVAFVAAGTVPPLVGVYTFALATFHAVHVRRDLVGPLFPRVAIVVPAWNEAAVLPRTLDRLAALEYPREALRVYVVDDASTDSTPELVQDKAQAHPGADLSPAPRAGRPGQGTHDQPRPGSDHLRRVVRGRADHRC